MPTMPFKPLLEPDTDDKNLRDSLKLEGKKPATTVNVDLGSSTTPLETRPSALTSAAATSSSGSAMDRALRTWVSRNPDSGSSTLSTAQLKSISTSMPRAFYAAQLLQESFQSKSSSGQSSKSNIPTSAGSSRFITSSAPQSAAIGRSPTISSRYPRRAPGSATLNIASRTPKQSGESSTATQKQVQIPGTGQGMAKFKVLEPGVKSYGYGSSMRESYFSPARPTTSGSATEHSVSSVAFDEDTLLKNMRISSNPEDFNKAGFNMFKKYSFSEALRLYDRALELSPANATYHINRADVLSSLCRIGEAVIECEEAIKLDPNSARAHNLVATLLLRLGQVQNAVKYFFAVIEPSDPTVVRVLEQVEKHLNQCTDARRHDKWNDVLTEVNAAMASGADWSPQLAMCKVEALLKLLRLDEAQTALELVPKVEPFPASFSQARFFGMNSEAYTYFVTSLMELALGRFESAVTAAMKASGIEPRNSEVEKLYRHVRLVAQACDRGSDLFESGRYSEASEAYEEGLKFDPFNANLFCQKAECFFKLGMWENSIEDCNHALSILPRFIEPLRKRAASYCKLERWAEAVRDYEILRKEIPSDKQIIESLFHAQVELKKFCREVEDISSLDLNKKSGVEVEEIYYSLEKLQAALTRNGISIVLYMRASDQKCIDMSVFMDALCKSYPSLHYLKVEIEKCPAVGEVEKVKLVPTFKIYRHGIQMKEIVCPTKEALESTVRHYGL